MFHVTPLLSISIFTLLVLSSAREDAIKKPLGGLTRTINPGVTPRDLQTRSLFQKRCTGTCAECFGTGYTECPNSSYYCYLPGDSVYGLDSCYGTGSTTATSSAPASTSTDYCYGSGVTCVSCFGANYLTCADGEHCYDPNDPQSVCPGDDSSSTSSSCADQYGSGSVPCGGSSCYNPDQGQVCCADGFYCEGGDTCSSIVGKCCIPGSTASGCSGSATGGLSTSSYTYSSYTYSSYTYSSYTFSTSTDSGLSVTTSTDSSSTTSTPFNQNDSGSMAPTNPASVQIMAVVLGLFGLGMLLL